MRRPIFLIAGIAAFAVAYAQVSTSALLTSFSKAINDAKTVKSDYTFQTIHAGGAEDYSVILKKPNLVRVETPSQLVIADGKDITTYDKAEKTYFKKPQTAADLKQIFAPDELHVWAGFFDANAYKAFRTKDIGNRSVKGGMLSAVEASYDAQERKVITYLLNPDDKIARKAQIELDKKDKEKSLSMVLDTKNLSVNSDISNDAFVFTAPADAKEMTLAEMNSTKWFYDLDQAKKVAAATGKKIFVDFYATWCGPCKRLEKDCFSTDEFKKFGSKLVFCRIDVDDQKSVAEAYGITAMPTQDVLDKDGKVLSQTIGYASPTEFFAFLRGAVGN